MVDCASVKMAVLVSSWLTVCACAATAPGAQHDGQTEGGGRGQLLFLSSADPWEGCTLLSFTASPVTMFVLLSSPGTTCFLVSSFLLILKLSFFFFFFFLHMHFFNFVLIVLYTSIPTNITVTHLYILYIIHTSKPSFPQL